MGAVAGKVALITGASSGLGRHFASVLAREGATVVVAARRVAMLEDLVARITASGGTAQAHVLDVTAPAQSLADSVAEIADRCGGLDILVNNSGIAVTKPMLEQTEDDWDRVMNTNLRGAFFLSQAAARLMRVAGRGGSIVNIASILGLRQAGSIAPYAVSKSGLVQLTKLLALELARDSIRVNAIAPGFIETDLNAEFFATEAGHALKRRIPQRRLGQPSDLEGALLLLCSDASAYMTGSVLAVDGGHLVSTL